MAAAHVKATRYRWVVLCIIWLSYFMCFADRGNIGVVIPELTKEFSLNKTESGALMSFFFIGYALTQIPAGFIASRFGIRGMMSMAILGFSVFTALIGTAKSAAMLKWYRVGLGTSEGPYPVAATSTIKSWFPSRERGTAVGIYMTATTLATMVTAPIAVWIMYKWGWRYVFFIFAIPGIVTALLAFTFIRTKPSESKFVNEAELKLINESDQQQNTVVKSQSKDFGLLDKMIRARKTKTLNTKADVLRSWNIWGITLSYFFAVSIVIGIMTWVPSYLVEVKGMKDVKMGWLAAMPWLGGTFGALLGGWISDGLLEKRRKPTMWITTLPTAVMLFVLINLPDNIYILGAGLFTIGFLLHVGWAAFTAYPMGLTTNETYPVAISVLNTGGNLGGFFSPILAGKILDLSNNNYNYVFIFLAACAIICWLLTTTLDEPIDY